ncbi:MAG: hypothetical protein OCU12_06215 [Methanophagales archaeon]|nr:hypothetical protein [Methanophagales archaeon]
MWISAYVRYSLKGRPKDFRGLRVGGWVLAKTEPAPLSSVGFGLVRHLISFAFDTGIIEELEEAVAVLRDIEKACHNVALALEDDSVGVGRRERDEIAGTMG